MSGFRGLHDVLNEARAEEFDVRDDMDEFETVAWNEVWPEWVGKAACAGMPLDWFFLAERAKHLSEPVKSAKSICRSCPVRLLCLEWVLMVEAQTPVVRIRMWGPPRRYGVFGGASADERELFAAAPIETLHRFLDAQAELLGIAS